jgi:hypothetical protein
MKKSTDQIYRALSPSAAAVVAWGLTMRNDDAEADRLRANVAKEYRVVPVLRFSETLLWLQGFAFLWGVTHWRLMSEWERSKLPLVAQAHDPDKVAIQLLMDAEGRLLACDSCLDSATAKYGFDGQSVRGLAQAVRFVPMVPDVVKDDQYEKVLFDALTAGDTGTGPTG